MGPSSACPLCGASKVSVYLEGSEQRLSHSSLGASRRPACRPGELCVARTAAWVSVKKGRPRRTSARLYHDMDVGAYESELGGRERTAVKHWRLVQRHCAIRRSKSVVPPACFWDWRRGLTGTSWASSRVWSLFNAPGETGESGRGCLRDPGGSFLAAEFF